MVSKAYDVNFGISTTTAEFGRDKVQRLKYKQLFFPVRFPTESCNLIG